MNRPSRSSTAGWRRAGAALGLASAVLLTGAGCAGDEVQEEDLTDVEDTEAPVDPPMDLESLGGSGQERGGGPAGAGRA